MRGRSRLMGVVAAGVVALVALTACSADDSTDGDQQARPGAAAPDDAPAAGGAGEPDGGQAGGAAVDARAIIFTGEVSLRVADVDRAATEAAGLAERYGGFVGGDERSTGEGGPHVQMVLRIPSERFAAAVDDLAGLGEERSREIRTEDVTEEVVDLASRIDTARASVERTRELLERADSIADIVSIEEQLTQREATLATLLARQRTLDDLTTLSTITVTLAGPEEPDREAGFVAGLRTGWKGFIAAIGLGLTIFGFLLPWLLVIGLPAGGIAWWVRRRGATRRAAAVPPDRVGG